MAKRESFHVLVATDGSAPARAAVVAAAAFPWPRGARLHGLIARGGWPTAELPRWAWEARDRRLERLRLLTRRVLGHRWPEADAVVMDAPPIPAILSQARALGARAIVVGSRGQGALGRWLLGSVSRAVVRSAECPVLVVRGRPRRIRHLAIGVDGSANSRRAVEVVARLDHSRGRVTLLSVVEPVRVPSTGLTPTSVRAAVAVQAARLNEQAVQAARRELMAATRRLRGGGWRVRSVVRLGIPLTELLAGAAAAGADVLILGARGVGGVARLLLGSVAEGVLGRSPISVVIVK